MFLGGVHGVGKSTLCNDLTEKLNINHYIASELIKQEKEINYGDSKQVKDPNQNQKILVKKIEQLKSFESLFILDGHFCVLDKNENPLELPIDTYKVLKPKAILVLYDDPEIILSNLVKRDKHKFELSTLQNLQTKELEHALSVSRYLNIPYENFKSSEKEIEEICNFINSLK
nr:ATP-binding protein [Salsuginibacillus kocurii]